jgi:hypothetical protein
VETRGKNRKGLRVHSTRVPKGTLSTTITKVRFTPMMWQRWLNEFNAGPDERDQERAEGIKEFRSLCLKPLDSHSNRDKKSTTNEG